jgi:hypothetical protein
MHVFIVFCSIAAMVTRVRPFVSRQVEAPHGPRWPIDHFLAYFAVTLIVYLAWPGPLVVGAALMGVSALLEGLQRFTVDRTPSFLAAFCGAGGALAAALLAELLLPQLQA